jgi:predicted RNA-binding protein YlqC (UPF0109 family)
VSHPEDNKDLVGESVNADQPEVTEPESSGPEAVEPEATEPEAIEPEGTEPVVSEAETSEPQTTEPAVSPSGKSHEELNLGQERVLEFVSFVVVNLVDHPEDVTVDIVRRQGRDIYQVRVNSEDLGKVIGKGGQTARALRVMLTALSSRTDQRVGLEIVE